LNSNKPLATKKKSADLTGNSAVSKETAKTQLEINDQKIPLLKNGIAKVYTVPITHERTFKNHNIGKKL
jgi:hypothetical protein